MKINKLSPNFLEAVCQYLNTDKAAHESGTRVSWEIDPGKLRAALEDAHASTTATFTGTDMVPEECEICGGDCITLVGNDEYECDDITLVGNDEYECDDCGGTFIYKEEHENN